MPKADFGFTETGFHAQNGFYFFRHPDGTVEVQTPASSIHLSASEWASVVAAVSPRGDSGEAHAEALRFHREADSTEVEGE
jgi:hypothetical protein